MFNLSPYIVIVIAAVFSVFSATINGKIKCIAPENHSVEIAYRATAGALWAVLVFVVFYPFMGQIFQYFNIEVNSTNYDYAANAIAILGSLISPQLFRWIKQKLLSLLGKQEKQEK